MDVTTRLRRSAQATYEIIEGEATVIDLRTGVYYTLNEVGTAFWNMLDGTKTIADCAAAIAAEYNAPLEVVTADLLEISADLVNEGLVEKV